MQIELSIIADIQLARKGKAKNIVKPINKLFNIHEIEVEEFIDPVTGKTLSKYAGVIFRDKYYKVDKPYKVLRDLINSRINPIVGFYQHSNAYKKKNKTA